MIGWITPVEITPGSPSSWVDADVSAYIPSGSTGVMLHIEAVFPGGSGPIGFRKNGSTDNRTKTTNYNTHFWCAIGVDASRILELYVHSISTINVYLVGYFGDESVFFANAVDKSLAVTGAWTDINISSDTGADTAIGAVFEVINSSTYSFGLRQNGSTDNRNYTFKFHVGAVIGVDASEICEGIISDTGCDFFLVGYIKSGASFYTNASDISLGSTGAWIDLTALPSDSVGGFIEAWTNWTGSETMGLRENGSAETIIQWLGGERHCWALVKCDSSQIIEGYINSLSVDFFLVGYVARKEISSADSGVLAEIPTARDIIIIDLAQGADNQAGREFELYDSLSGAEYAAIVFSGIDSGTGTETVIPETLYLAVDSAAASESPTDREFTITESAMAADLPASREFSSSDSSIFTESDIAPVGRTDAGAGEEGIPQFTFLLTDAAAVAENAVLIVTISALDASADFAELSTLQSSFIQEDSSAMEPIAEVFFQTDSSAGITETSSLLAAIPAIETGAGLDARLLMDGTNIKVVG